MLNFLNSADTSHVVSDIARMPAGIAWTVLLIHGMRDNRCRERVIDALERVSGTREVQVNLFRARAMIVHGAECAPNDLVAAVVRAGYDAEVVLERDTSTGTRDESPES